MYTNYIYSFKLIFVRKVDNENGEIQFLKKNENFNNEMDEENLDQTCDENIMIIKLPEHMDTEDYTEEFEDVCLLLFSFSVFLLEI